MTVNTGSESGVLGITRLRADGATSETLGHTPRT